MYRLEIEFDNEPAYIFRGNGDEPVITVAPGNAVLARKLLAWLDATATDKAKAPLCPNCAGEIEATGDCYFCGFSQSRSQQ